MKPADIKLLRSQLGLTQPQFAELIGVKPRTVQSYEGGVSYPGGKTLLKLQELFTKNNVPVTKTSIPYLRKGKENISITEIGIFAEENQEEFWSHSYFEKEINFRVTKKFMELMKDPKKFKEFLNS